MQQELDGQGESNTSSIDESIQHALVVGDYKGAVSQCISANRMADALVIANVGGTSLWESTRDQFLKKSHLSYLKVVSAMVNNDLTSLVNTRPLHSWKETLALLCTYAERKDWTLLCGSLASRLVAVGNTLAATLCYICAGNIDKTVEIWSRNLKLEHDGRTYVDLLQDLMEKTIVFAKATEQKRFSASLSKLVENYAELLASQGLLTTAMEYLKLLESNESSHELAILRDRIALSSQDKEAPKIENNQLEMKSVYGTDQSGFEAMDRSQHYYQTQQRQNVPGSSYDDNYQQQQAQYTGGYNNPGSYQPSPTSQQMFHPNPNQEPSQHAQQTNFQNFSSQPVVGKFSFSTPPQLKNLEQYQQPISLGSHLYPGNPNAPYQTLQTASGPLSTMATQMPVSGQSLPQVTAPNATVGYKTSGNSGFVQRPGMGLMQPPSPTQPTQVGPAVTPAAAPPTVQTVDTSNVPAQQRPVVSTLTRLFNETSEAVGGSHANPAKKREIEENSRKIGALFAKLNSGDISKNAADKLVQLCQALDSGDFSTALQIQVLLTTSEWDECNFWLSALKRMIKTRQSARIN